MARARETPKWPPDFKGPNGAKRIRVKLGDIDSDFDEMFEEDEVEATISKKNKSTIDDVRNLSRMALAGNDEAMFAYGGAEDSESARDKLKATFRDAVVAHGAGMLRGASGSLDDIDLEGLAAAQAKQPKAGPGASADAQGAGQDGDRYDDDGNIPSEGKGKGEDGP